MTTREPEDRPAESTVPLTPPGARGSTGAGDALVGKVLDGRYDVKSVLGEGGMGTVYLAEDVKLGRRVALKVMGDALLREPEFRARFEREAVLQANLPHPQVIQIMDMGEAAEGAYLVLEYSNGRPLSRLLKDGGPMPIDRALGIAAQILEVLEFAHEQNVVHRDLKPANILIEERGGKQVVRLLDFGIAKLISPEGGGQLEHTLTKHGSSYGTLGYMAPEQARGDVKAVDHRVDLYAVGIMLHEMLTGEVPAPPESRTHPVRYAMWVAENPIPPLSERFPDLEAVHQVDQFLLKAVRRDPAQRYKSARAFAEALDEFRHSAAATTVERLVAPTVAATEVAERGAHAGAAASLSRRATTVALAVALVVVGVLFLRARQDAEDSQARIASLEVSLASGPSMNGDEAPGTLQERIKELETEIAVIHQPTIVDLSNRLEKSESERRSLREELVSKTAEMQKDRGRADAAEALAAADRQTSATLRKDLSARTSEVQEARSERDRLAKEASDALEEISGYKSREEASKAAQARLVEDLKNEREDLSEANREVARLNQELKDLREDLDSDDARTELQRLRKREGALNAEVEAANKRILELEQRLKQRDRPATVRVNTLKIYNRFSQPLKLVRMSCVLDTGETAPVQLPKDPEITSGRSLDIDLPPSAVRVNLTYYRFDWANRRFKVSPISRTVTLSVPRTEAELR